MPRSPVDRSVTAVERTFTILGAFLDGGGILTLPELEQKTGLFKSVIWRYLISFERHGYIFKRDDGKYQLGVTALRLGKTYEKTFDISQHVLPALQRLADATGESASYYVRENDMRLCLYRVEAPRSLRVSVAPGSLWPLDETATGQIFRRYADGYAPPEDGDPRAFLTHSVNIGREETSSTSAPVFGLNNTLTGALTVSGPTSRYDSRNNETARGMLVREAAALSARLGALDAYPAQPCDEPPAEPQADAEG